MHNTKTGLSKPMPRGNAFGRKRKLAGATGMPAVKPPKPAGGGYGPPMPRPTGTPNPNRPVKTNTSPNKKYKI